MKIIKDIVLNIIGFIQYTKLVFNRKYFDLVVGDIDPLEVLKLKLQSRKFAFNKNQKINFFLIFSINNWESIFIDEFKKFGLVKHFNWKNVDKFFENRDLWESFFDNLNHQILNSFDEYYNEVDNFVVFLYTSDFCISNETIIKIQRKNVLIISFCWDDLLYFKSKVKGQPIGVSKLSKAVDFNLTMSPEAISRYLYNNSPVFFWSSLKRNDLNYEFKSSVRDIDKFYVLFIGSKYGWRGKFISKLIQKGIDVVCFGKGWENGSITFDEMINQIKLAPVTLGFANVGHTKSITTIKGRDFEVPLFGGLYLTQYSRGLSYYYIINKDVLTYNNFEDCVNILNKIKSNPMPYEIVRNNGIEKAHENATWNSRLLFLMDFISKL
ncbi:glycosyltransferase family protein [Aquirufa antheringensis]